MMHRLECQGPFPPSECACSCWCHGVDRCLAPLSVGYCGRRRGHGQACRSWMLLKRDADRKAGRLRMFRRPPRPRTCFGCRAREGVRHFNLTIAYYREGETKPRGRGAGTIDLCASCWTAASSGSAVRARPRRDRRRIA